VLAARAVEQEGARQFCAIDHRATAVPSGSERSPFSIVTPIPLNHAASGRFPKLRVAGSNPVVRFKRKPRS